MAARIRLMATLLTLIGLLILMAPELPREWGTVAILIGLFGPSAYAEWARRGAMRRRPLLRPPEFDGYAEAGRPAQRLLRVLRGGQARARREGTTPPAVRPLPDDAAYDSSLPRTHEVSTVHSRRAGPWQPAPASPSGHQLLAAAAIVAGAAGAFLFLIVPFGLMTGGLGFLLAALLLFCCWYLYRGHRAGSWLDGFLKR